MSSHPPVSESNTQIALWLLVDVSADTARESGQQSLDAEAAARTLQARFWRLVGSVMGVVSVLRDGRPRPGRQREDVLLLSRIGTGGAAVGYVLQFVGIAGAAVISGLGGASNYLLVPSGLIVGLLLLLALLSYRTRTRGLLPRRNSADNRWMAFNWLQFFVVVFFVSAMWMWLDRSPSKDLWIWMLVPAITFFAGAVISYVGNSLLVRSMEIRNRAY